MLQAGPIIQVTNRRPRCDTGRQGRLCWILMTHPKRPNSVLKYGFG
jgi:hypothetical protein